MEIEDNHTYSLAEVIRSRRSVRSFAPEALPADDVKQIIQSAILAPYGGATGMPLNEIRKIFVLSQQTASMGKARELLLAQIRNGARKLNILLALMPFLNKKMKPFSNRLNGLAKDGISGLNDAAYYIICLLYTSPSPRD